jgi:hypothetical protein
LVKSLPILVAIALMLFAAPPTRAETEVRATIAVVGDSLADGMWGGIYRTVQKDKRINVFRGAKNSVGFTGGDLTDMIDRAFAAGEVHALVMMIGANDRRTIFVDGRPRAQLGTPAWLDLYRERVARFMDHAGKRDVPLVWLLLPVMRDPQASRDAEAVNAIVVETASTRPHVHVIDTVKLTGDANGQYQAHFTDLTGQRRQMRAGDGVHFEMPAYELFADLVLKRLREASPRFAKLAE